ncbi:hypothetical protein ACIPW9_37020 [Streptomyces sp. NPDC090052]|uniref:hypothetical protein n=1 Tax=Streptomyces sp. NPDC090052 TaxID=3365931 RepID=UPI00380906BD
MSADRAAVEETAEEEETEERPHLELVEEPGRMAALRADLLPYLPTRRNLTGLGAGVGAGTLVLLSKGWTWIWAEGLQDAGMRAGGVLLAGYAGCSAVLAMSGPYTPYLPVAAVAGWVVAAKHQAPKDRKPQPTSTTAAADRDDIEDQDDDEPEYLDDEPLAVEDVAAIVRRVAACHPKHLGVHLSDLLTEPEFEGWEQAELKSALTESWGLPVVSFKLSFPGRARTREGVRLEHLPPAPERAAPGAGEGAARGLALVPSQHPAGAGPGTPASTPSEVPAEVAVSPSPSAAAAPSQGPG